MKKLILTILMIAMVMNTCGCAAETYTMNVHVYYHGWGFGGPNPEGSFDYTIENVRAGDYFYEWEGELRKATKEEKGKGNWFIRIDQVDEENAMIVADTGIRHETFQGKEFNLYGPSSTSDIMVYYYIITFTRNFSR